MTNYNERLDEVLQQNIQFTLLGEFPNAVPDHNNWVNVMGRVYSFDFTEAKQAITSLIKELVAEARIDELKLLADFQMGDITVMGRNERSWRDRISELEQNILNALEEV